MPSGMKAATAPSVPNRLVVAPVAWSYSSAAGNSAKSKKLQNQPTKNITSDAMNRIIP